MCCVFVSRCLLLVVACRLLRVVDFGVVIVYVCCLIVECYVLVVIV